jgi:hypothetical protein
MVFGFALDLILPVRFVSIWRRETSTWDGGGTRISAENFPGV